MILSCIAAVAENGVIGRDNSLPWHLAADLKRFKKLTTGHWTIMGRKTYESAGGPLPNRTAIVLTRDCAYQAPGAVVVHSLDEALERSRDQDEVFVLGGEPVFREALPRAQKLYLTRVHAAVEGDARFPDFDTSEWKLVESVPVPADENNDYPTTYEVYLRKAG